MLRKKSCVLVPQVDADQQIIYLQMVDCVITHGPSVPLGHANDIPCDKDEALIRVGSLLISVDR